MRLSEIIKSEKPALAVLRKVDEKLLNTNIDAMIISVCSLFKLNENKTFTDTEILEATNLLKVKYYFLKWDDLLLFVQNVKLGRYNDIYNRWDMPTFFQMLDRYCDERAETATTINRVEQEERKNEPLSPETLELLAEFNKNAVKKKIENINPLEISESEADKIVKVWIEEFRKEVGNLTGFMDFEGKKIDVHQYLAIKNKSIYG